MVRDFFFERWWWWGVCNSWLKSIDFQACDSSNSPLHVMVVSWENVKSLKVTRRNSNLSFTSLPYSTYHCSPLFSFASFIKVFLKRQINPEELESMQSHKTREIWGLILKINSHVSYQKGKLFSVHLRGLKVCYAWHNKKRKKVSVMASTVLFKYL